MFLIHAWNILTPFLRTFDSLPSLGSQFPRHDTTPLQCILNEDLKEEWEKYFDETPRAPKSMALTD